MKSNNATSSGLSRAWLILLTVLVLLCGHSSKNCHAQAVHDFGSWFSVNTQGTINRCDQESPWRWWFDGHLRYLDDADGFNQSIFRPGLGYQLNQNTSVWIGYAWINENPTSGNPVFDEHRIWQQAIWTNTIGEQAVMSRSRFEQRFVETGNDTGLRFRQMFRMSRPFSAASPFTFVAWDEAFFDLNKTNFGQTGSFSQNRAFVGIGREFNGPNSPRIEVGYLNQFIDRKSSSDSFNHILSVNWFWNF